MSLLLRNLRGLAAGLTCASMLGACGYDAAPPPPPPSVVGDAALTLSRTSDLGVAYADSSVNVSSFRQPVIPLGQDRRLVSYYDEQGDVRLKLLTNDGRELRSVVVGPRLDDNLLGDGHCVISLGRSPDGFVHVMYGAHATLPFYARIPESELLAETGAQRYDAVVWQRLLSYPQFYQVGDAFQLWFRADPETAVHRTPYDLATGTFTQAGEQQILAHGDAERVYMNHLAVRGNSIGLTWMYRLHSQDDFVRNEGLFLAYSDDRGVSWRTAAGAPLTVPVDRGVVPAFLPVPSSLQPMNQTASAYAPDGRLFVTYLAEDLQGIHQVSVAELSSTGALTSAQAVSTNQTRYDLLGRGTLVLPLSRPQIAISDRYIHVIYRQDNKIRVSSRELASPGIWTQAVVDAGNLGPWEPALATDLWASERKLVIYVQETRQGALDRPEPGPATHARLFEFSENVRR